MDMSKFFLLASFSLAVANANAVPINYSESGNQFEEAFGSYDGPNAIFALDLGVNSISGTQRAGDHTGDAFGFTVQEGQQLTGAFFSVLSMSGGSFLSASASLGDDISRWSGNLGSSRSVEPGQSGSFSVYSWNYLDLPLDSGTYLALCCSSGSNGAPQFTYRFDFTVELAPPPPEPEPVVAVPEPASIALVLSGLMGMGLRRRKRSQ